MSDILFNMLPPQPPLEGNLFGLDELMYQLGFIKLKKQTAQVELAKILLGKKKSYWLTYLKILEVSMFLWLQVHSPKALLTQPSSLSQLYVQASSEMIVVTLGLSSTDGHNQISRERNKLSPHSIFSYK